MNRLTTKNEQFNDYSVAEQLRHLDVKEYITMTNNKLGKYEDLEEQIGCPLQVRCQIVNGTIIIDNNKQVYGVIQINESGFYAIQICNINEMVEFYWKDYQRTWW